jgi:hypothetical protein
MRDRFLQPGSPLFHHINRESCYTLVVRLAFVGEYWLQSTLFRASFAASITNFGGLYPLLSGGSASNALSFRTMAGSAYSQKALSHVDYPITCQLPNP